MKKILFLLCMVTAFFLFPACNTPSPSEPHPLLMLRDGRSMRETSTRKLPDGRPDPDSNYDNFRVQPGETHILADLKGPGIITHIWITFLGPGPHPWAKGGAADVEKYMADMKFEILREPVQSHFVPTAEVLVECRAAGEMLADKALESAKENTEQ